MGAREKTEQENSGKRWGATAAGWATREGSTLYCQPDKCHHMHSLHSTDTTLLTWAMPVRRSSRGRFWRLRGGLLMLKTYQPYYSTFKGFTSVWFKSCPMKWAPVRGWSTAGVLLWCVNWFSAVQTQTSTLFRSSHAYVLGILHIYILHSIEMFIPASPKKILSTVKGGKEDTLETSRY